MNTRQRIIRSIAVLIISAAVLLFALVLDTRALSPSDGRVFRGIDVSEFQGDIDFDRVRQDGIEAVYIRAGVGSDYTDAYFDENYDKAKAAGLKVGLYHYVTARSVDEGRRQARFFASLAAGRELELRLAMDFEYFGSLSVREINQISKVYLEELTALTEKEAVIYSDTSNAIRVFDIELARKYPLWVAQYGADEPSDNGKWDSWVGFQYSDVGRVSGIYGNVDSDLFTSGILLTDTSKVTGERRSRERSRTQTVYVCARPFDTVRRLARRYETAPNNIESVNGFFSPFIFSGRMFKITLPAREKGVESYTVRPCDTLTFLSGRFGVNVSAIKDINSKKSSLIYPGEVLKIPSAEKSGQFFAVRSGDTLLCISRATGVPVRTIIGINRLKEPYVVLPGEQLKLSE